ncbi:MAG TPA: hypothetical protein VFX70_18430 [Mycobacteriales bacterium]|nr:hypothetical protein [Mycobacteriales bacterium]
MRDLSACQSGWGREDTDGLAAVLDGAVTIDGQTARRVAHEWLVHDPPQVVETRAGRHVGNGMVVAIEQRTAELRRLDDHMGGGDLLGVVTAELGATVTLAREASYTEATGRRLFAGIGDLAQLAGWVASDAGDHQAAARYYLGGLQAAHAAADDALAANLLSLLSYQTACQGDPREAILLARTAYRGAPSSATPAVRALMGERVAWAYATAGDADGCQRALDEVDTVFGATTDGEPDWAYWLNWDEIRIMAGRCYTELRRPMKAVPLLDAALRVYDSGLSREVALYLTWLAESYIHAREIDQAADAVSRALTVSTTVNSARSRDRVSTVRTRLHPYKDATSVKQFEEQYRATMKR